MANYKDLFMYYMDSQNIKYEDKSEFCVKVTYTGSNLKSIPVLVYFDKEGEGIVQFKCWEILNFKEMPERGYKACNEANAQWRWVKYYLDDDMDVVASIDAYIDAETCGKECLDLVRRVVNITDKAFPAIAKHRWG